MPRHVIACQCIFYQCCNFQSNPLKSFELIVDFLQHIYSISFSSKRRCNISRLLVMFLTKTMTFSFLWTQLNWEKICSLYVDCMWWRRLELFITIIRFHRDSCDLHTLKNIYCNSDFDWHMYDGLYDIVSFVFFIIAKWETYLF